MADLYAQLGVAKDATKAAIKAAFRRAAKDAHPDAGGSPEQFYAIERAHRVLTDDSRRERYDRDGTLDTEPDNADAQAMSVIASIVDRFIADEQAKYKNLVGEIRKELNSDIATAKRSIDEARKFELRTIDLRKRVKGKGATVILAMFDQKLRDAGNAVTALERAIATRERALALLEETEFDAEKMAEPPVFRSPFLYNQEEEFYKKAHDLMEKPRRPNDNFFRTP
jgi:curved DNA-binding protein CbpA